MSSRALGRKMSPKVAASLIILRLSPQSLDRARRRSEPAAEPSAVSGTAGEVVVSHFPLRLRLFAKQLDFDIQPHILRSVGFGPSLSRLADSPIPRDTTPNRDFRGHAVPSIVSQPVLPEVIGSSPISRLSLLSTLVLNQGPFPPPALPGFAGTTDPSATPRGLACPSRVAS